ncbi:hypothetical protein HPB52_022497 [Rhipicephalus sanguineus]|uniref:Uncharacterized protein n=1 Tax=Rhipicephalus sanguineus TaxID=34632 RepID=A0A9D4PIW8_RHISA|nr:hypothetical protein HPB52_022497 [Rhipicephalus sanguineus]
MDYLKDKEAALSMLDDVILATTGEEKLDQEVETAHDDNEKIPCAVSRAKFWLRDHERTARTQAGASEPGPSNLGSPNFGDATGQPFWDHFDATIHKNTELPRIEKIRHLLTCLTGSPKQAIKGIRLAEQNYDLAFKTLTDRSGRPDLLVNEHVDHLFTLSTVKSSSEVLKLRLLHGNVQFHVSALEGLGVSPDQYTVVLNVS